MGEPPQPWAHDTDCNQRRPTANAVNNGRAGEVMKAGLLKPPLVLRKNAATPDPVTYDREAETRAVRHRRPFQPKAIWKGVWEIVRTRVALG